MNISEEETMLDWHFRGSHEENIAFVAFYILILVFAVPGNVMALSAFCHQKSTSPSKVFLCHLAIADITYILLLPMRIVYHLYDTQWPLGHVLCQLAGFLFYLNMYCSLYLMSLISLDRCISVVMPIKSQSIRKAQYAKVIVTVLWLLVTACMCPMLFSKKDNPHDTQFCNKLYLEKKSSTALVSTVVAFAIPLTCIVLTYLFILLRLRRKEQNNWKPVKHKVKKMIILILVIFLVAFVPYHVSRIIYIHSHSLEHVSKATQESLGRVNWITSALACVNGVLDPVLYFFLNTAFRSKPPYFDLLPRYPGRSCEVN
uniref:Si:dkey-96n2.3 n=1 Tax=Neogobius melanostomus TaxID=47308 RepID=A0A8C6WYT8_9GOBI